MVRVLLVEDDDAIAEPLARALRREGYAVELATTGQAAVARGRQDTDVVVLDLGLPDIDGLEVCRRLRASGSRVPVLMLTSRTGELDAIVGLDAGADDYVPKPFRLGELLARLRALLRRTDVGGGTATMGGLTLDASTRRVTVDDRPVVLSVKEFDVLAAVMARRGAVVSRADLVREVWQTEWVGSTKTLDMHVSSLRRKLGDDVASPRYVVTVRGVGYRLGHD
ncbi:MAG: response regulator transcription factor [Actinomycetota bacterium]|nr:response regulator transcription factor [Actinomycetota bacterium]MDH4352576.1 response regulator transcription factor [Actinomycetota bacterium]